MRNKGEEGRRKREGGRGKGEGEKGSSVKNFLTNFNTFNTGTL